MIPSIVKWFHVRKPLDVHMYARTSEQDAREQAEFVVWYAREQRTIAAVSVYWNKAQSNIPWRYWFGSEVSLRSALSFVRWFYSSNSTIIKWICLRLFKVFRFKSNCSWLEISYMWIFIINYYSQKGRKIYEYRLKGEKEMRNNKSFMFVFMDLTSV